MSATRERGSLVKHFFCLLRFFYVRFSFIGLELFKSDAVAVTQCDVTSGQGGGQLFGRWGGGGGVAGLTSDTVQSLTS